MGAPPPQAVAESRAAILPIKRVSEAEPQAQPQAKQAMIPKSDPKKVLATMAWPATINAWGMVQKQVWAGHPKLMQGWIRVWSKSQDNEYYLRLRDMKTTFDIDEVLFRG